MLYEVAHIIKKKFSFLWNMIEWGNAMVFSVMKRNQLKEVPSVLHGCSDVYEIRIADEADVEGLVAFFANQPKEAFTFFKSHRFDAQSVRRVVKNKAFMTFLVKEKGVIIGYFFLRCFVNGKAFRGKMVDINHQGRGLAKLMGVAMTKVTSVLGVRMFGSISPENYASLASAKASNEIKIHKTLENGDYYIEFLEKK